MTDAEHERTLARINAFRAGHGRYPTHEQILLFMMQEASEVTYLDALEYGLGSTFRSRISDLRRVFRIESYDKPVPTRYGTTATVKAHRLMEAV